MPRSRHRRFMPLTLRLHIKRTLPWEGSDALHCPETSSQWQSQRKAIARSSVEQTLPYYAREKAHRLHTRRQQTALHKAGPAPIHSERLERIQHLQAEKRSAATK